jgi:purine-nucleoside phosphorylase
MSPARFYNNPLPTVDIIIEMEGDKIVLIKRKNPPLGWALPGGFVEVGESLEQAAGREAREETSLSLTGLRQFRTYSNPGRDPRHHTISTVFIARGQGTARARDDALTIGVFDRKALPSPLAFDHALILEDYFRQRLSPNKGPGNPRPADDSFQTTLSLIRKKISPDTGIGLVLGTGLGGLAEHIRQARIISYQDLPDFPHSTVASHQGRLIGGTLAGKNVLALQGRFHLYEGYSPREIGFPIRILKALGLKVIILSNAAGGLDPLFRPGDIMLLTDQINFTGENPLIGPHREEWGPRFPDMSQVYDRELQALTEKVALEKRIPLRKGIYLGVKGPSLETPAETRFLRSLGAQAVGMSTIMEAIVAVQSGLRILGLSVISNVNLPDCLEPASIAAIIKTAQEAEPALRHLVKGVISKLTL